MDSSTLSFETRINVFNSVPSDHCLFPDMLSKQCECLMLDLSPPPLFERFGYNRTIIPQAGAGSIHKSHYVSFNAFICIIPAHILLLNGLSMNTNSPGLLFLLFSPFHSFILILNAEKICDILVVDSELLTISGQVWIPNQMGTVKPCIYTHTTVSTVC